MSTIIERSAKGLSYLKCEGAGEAPVVLLHGLGSNAHSFEPLMQALAIRHPSIAWNMPGYGESKPLSVKWPDSSHYAKALNRLLAHLKLTRCILIGHSLGCLIAARYTTMFPTQVTALVLISPAVGYQANKGGPMPPQVAKRINDLDRLGPEQFAAKRGWMLLADGIPNPEVLRAVQTAMAAVRRPGYDQAARMLACGWIYNDIPDIETPTAVLNGWKDYVTAAENANFVWGALEYSCKRRFFRLIKDAGHAVCQEKPDEVAGVIAEFLEAKEEAPTLVRGLKVVVTRRAGSCR
jgi:pimeloyl-ACP methyl ester carboxylesterase